MRSRAFVVQLLEMWFESCLDEALMDNFECIQNAFGRVIAKWFHKDVVAVIVVDHNYKVVVASSGWKGQ